MVVGGGGDVGVNSVDVVANIVDNNVYAIIMCVTESQRLDVQNGVVTLYVIVIIAAGFDRLRTRVLILTTNTITIELTNLAIIDTVIIINFPPNQRRANRI